MDYETMFKNEQAEHEKTKTLLKSTTAILAKANDDLDNRNKQIADLHKELATSKEEPETKREPVKKPNYKEMFV